MKKDKSHYWTFITFTIIMGAFAIDCFSDDNMDAATVGSLISFGCYMFAWGIKHELLN